MLIALLAVLGVNLIALVASGEIELLLGPYPESVRITAAVREGL